MVLGRFRVFASFRVSMLAPGPPKGSLRIEAGDDYEVEARDNVTTNTVRCCRFRAIFTLTCTLQKFILLYHIVLYHVTSSHEGMAN